MAHKKTTGRKSANRTLHAANSQGEGSPGEYVLSEATGVAENYASQVLVEYALHRPAPGKLCLTGCHFISPEVNAWTFLPARAHWGWKLFPAARLKLPLWIIHRRWPRHSGKISGY